MDRSRTATCILLGFMALAFVALALFVNWARARTGTLGAAGTPPGISSNAADRMNPVRPV